MDKIYADVGPQLLAMLGDLMMQIAQYRATIEALNAELKKLREENQ